MRLKAQVFSRFFKQCAIVLTSVSAVDSLFTNVCYFRLLATNQNFFRLLTNVCSSISHHVFVTIQFGKGSVLLFFKKACTLFLKVKEFLPWNTMEECRLMRTALHQTEKTALFSLLFIENELVLQNSLRFLRPSINFNKTPHSIS